MADDLIKTPPVVRQPTKYLWDRTVIVLSVPRVDQNGLEFDQESMEISIMDQRNGMPFLDLPDQPSAVSLCRAISRKLGKIV